MYPPNPRYAPLGTGVNWMTNVSTSPTFAKVLAPPPGTGRPCGSMSATVWRLIRFAVATCATESAFASVPTSSDADVAAARSSR